MRRIYLFLMIGSLFVMASLPAAHAGANGRVDEILANMQKTASTIRTLQATLKQETRNLAIGGTETYRGEVFFRHVGKNVDQVRISYSVPAGRDQMQTAGCSCLDNRSAHEALPLQG